MANILAGLGGLFTGASQGYNEYRDRLMREMLERAALSEKGALFAPGMTQPQANVAFGPDVVPGAGEGAPPAAPTADVSAGTPGPDLSAGSMPTVPTPPAVGSPAAASGKLDATGKTPTDQASLIALQRAAARSKPAATPGAGTPLEVGGGPTPKTSAIAAPTTAPSAPLSSPFGSRGGEPAPESAAPADPTGGALAMLKKLSQPRGVNQIGPGTFMPVYQPPGVQENTRAMATLLAQAAGQGREITSREKISQSEIDAANQRAILERAQQKAALEHSDKVLTASMQRFGIGVDTKSVSDATGHLQKYEDAATNIQSALNALDEAKTNPSVTTTANLQTFLSLAAGPAGNAPQVRAQIIGIAGGQADESMVGKVERLGTMIASGKFPQGQIANLRSALIADRAGLAKQYDDQIAAEVAGHPQSTGLGDILQARRAHAFRGITETADASPKPTMADYKRMGKSLADYQKDKAAGLAQ